MSDNVRYLHGRNDFLADWCAEIDYRRMFPAFTDEIGIDMSISFLRKRAPRTLVVQFKYTPTWEHYDLQKRELVTWDMDNYEAKFFIETRPHYVEHDGLTRDIVEVPFYAPGLITTGQWDDLKGEVDNFCKMLDAERREEFGLPPRQWRKS